MLTKCYLFSASEEKIYKFHMCPLPQEKCHRPLQKKIQRSVIIIGTLSLTILCNPRSPTEQHWASLLLFYNTFYYFWPFQWFSQAPCQYCVVTVILGKVIDWCYSIAVRFWLHSASRAFVSSGAYDYVFITNVSPGIPKVFNEAPSLGRLWLHFSAAIGIV